MQYKERKINFLETLQALLVRITTLFVPGAALATFTFFITPTSYSLLILLLYIFLILFKGTVSLKSRKFWGRVYDKKTKKSIPLAVVKLYKKKYLVPKEYLVPQEIQVTDQTGRFNFLSKQGDYILTVDKVDYESWRSEEIKVGKEGFLAMKIALERSLY